MLIAAPFGCFADMLLGIFPDWQACFFRALSRVMLVGNQTFADVVKHRLEELGTNAYAIEQKLGLPSDTIRSVIRTDAKQASPRLDRVQTICDALGLEFYVGPVRQPHPYEKISLGAPNPYLAIDPLDFGDIDQDSSSINAGAPTSPITFNSRLFRLLGVDRRNVRIAKVQDQTMQPRILEGDYILVDTQNTQPLSRRGAISNEEEDEVFVVRKESKAVMRIVRRTIEGHYVMFSRNPEHFTPEFLSAESFSKVIIIGKIIWRGGKL